MKNVLIFGDSYSTFKGYVPEGYAVYYSEEGREETDVNKVGQTWWHQVISECGMNLVLNNSWSGSTIGYTGYGGEDCSRTSSFICRLKKLVEDGFFEKNKIDTVFIFGGTNDSWSDAPLGELKFDDTKEEDLYCVLPAICHFFREIKSLLEDADIYCIINTELKEKVTEGLKTASEKFGITAIPLKDIDKNSGHPTIKGMNAINKQVIDKIK